MSVAFTGSGTAGNVNGSYSATISTTGYTIGAGSNQVLYLCLNVDQVVSAPSATWHGVSMTLVNTLSYPGGPSTQYIFRLINPDVGNYTATANWTTNSPSSMSVASFSGVDQTTPNGTFVTATGTSTAPSTGAVTSGTGDATVAFASSEDAATANVAFTTPETQTGIYRNTATGTEAVDANSYALGGSSNTHSFTLTASKNWGASGVRVLAVSATAPVLSSLLLLGVG